MYRLSSFIKNATLLAPAPFLIHFSSWLPMPRVNCPVAALLTSWDHLLAAHT